MKNTSQKSKTNIQGRKKKSLKSKEYILYDFIYVKFQKADQRLGPGAKGHERTFGDDGKVPCSGCWVGLQLCTCQNSINFSTLKMDAAYYIKIISQLKNETEKKRQKQKHKQVKKTWVKPHFLQSGD